MNNLVDLKDLTTKYTDMIYHIALRFLNTKEDAEDIVQEVFLKYIRYVKAGKVFDTEEYEKYWLIRVTVNMCCNEICSARRRKTLPFKDCLYTELNIDSENTLHDALNKLSNKYKEVFILHHIEDMKISEISKALNISECNVKTRLKRARQKLKCLIEKGEKSYEKI